MKRCPTRGQSVAEERSICTPCGSEINEGRLVKDKASLSLKGGGGLWQ